MAKEDSRFFDMKWAPASAMDHDNLLAGQAIAQANPQKLDGSVPKHGRGARGGLGV